MPKLLPTVQLYRRLLCAARKLPHAHLRSVVNASKRTCAHPCCSDFYRLRYNVEFRRHRYTQGQTLENQIKRGHAVCLGRSAQIRARVHEPLQELRMLERANGSQIVAAAKRLIAFDKTLDMAYGRSGPLKQEIFNVHLSASTVIFHHHSHLHIRFIGRSRRTTRRTAPDTRPVNTPTVHLPALPCAQHLRHCPLSSP